MGRKLVTFVVILCLVVGAIPTVRAASEDFTTYTEVDVEGVLTVVAARVTWVSMDRDDECRVYSPDQGATLNFEHWFDFCLTDAEAGDADTRFYLTLYAFKVGTTGSLPVDSIALELREVGATDDKFTTNLRHYETGFGWRFQSLDTTQYDADGTMHYVIVARSGGDFSFDMYSTSVLRTAGGIGSGDEESYSNTDLASDTYRYVHVAWSANSGVDGADYSSGYIENLDLAPTVEQDVSYPLFENVSIFASGDADRALMFTRTGLVNVWASLTSNQERGFVLSSSIFPYASITVGKELLRQIAGVITLFTSVETVTEGVIFELAVTLFEAATIVVSLATVIDTALLVETVLGIAVLGLILALVALSLAVLRRRSSG